jgi:probable HAF family extracellular repeat protein
MKVRIFTHIALMTLFAVLVSSLPVAGQDGNNLSSPPHNVRYVVKDLGTLGGTSGVAEGISDRGRVVGSANLLGDQNERAFLCELNIQGDCRDGVLTDLGTLGGENSQVQFAVNDNRGLIVGDAEISATDPHNEDFCGFDRTGGVPSTGLICVGFLWHEGAMTALPTLGGNNARAIGVNNLGQVVGIAEKSTKDTGCYPAWLAGTSPQLFDVEAVIWGPRAGQIQTLPPLPGEATSWATGINDRQQVVGVSGHCHSPNLNEPVPEHGVIWQNGMVTSLGSLGGTLETFPWATNSKGQVVGDSSVPCMPDSSGNCVIHIHAFLWEEGTMRDLGLLPGDTDSIAFGLNDKGQVVGGSATQSSARAFLWQNGMMTDLNTLVTPGSTPLYLLNGNEINSRGEIATYACLACLAPQVEFHAALVIPCDEQHTDISACNESAAAVAQTTANITVAPATSANPKVTLPENVRDQLRRRLGLARFGGGPMKLQQPN